MPPEDLTLHQLPSFSPALLGRGLDLPHFAAEETGTQRSEIPFLRLPSRKVAAIGSETTQCGSRATASLLMLGDLPELAEW